jgi:hypothetical protein
MSDFGPRRFYHSDHAALKKNNVKWKILKIMIKTTDFIEP